MLSLFSFSFSFSFPLTLKLYLEGEASASWISPEDEVRLDLARLRSGMFPSNSSVHAPASFRATYQVGRQGKARQGQAELLDVCKALNPKEYSVISDPQILPRARRPTTLTLTCTAMVL